MQKFREAARKLVSTKTLELNASPTDITSYITVRAHAIPVEEKT